MHLMEYFLDEGGAVAHAAVVEALVTAALGVGVGYLASLRAGYEWRKAQFKDRLNISLNIVSDDTLRIRTIREDRLDAIILSPYALRLIRRAVKRTTADDEFLHFKTERDGWLVYNELVNAISEIYGGHLLAAASRDTYTERKFIIALTFERGEDIRIQKIRVLLMEEKLLLLLLLMETKNISFEAETHKVRLQTLRAMGENRFHHHIPDYQTISLPIP